MASVPHTLSSPYSSEFLLKNRHFPSRSRSVKRKSSEVDLSGIHHIPTCQSVQCWPSQTPGSDDLRTRHLTGLKKGWRPQRYDSRTQSVFRRNMASAPAAWEDEFQFAPCRFSSLSQIHHNQHDGTSCSGCLHQTTRLPEDDSHGSRSTKLILRSSRHYSSRGSRLTLFSPHQHPRYLG